MDDAKAEAFLFEIMREKDAEIEQLLAAMTKQRDRYISAMLWMRDQDPQMVDAAAEKFGLDLDGP